MKHRWIALIVALLLVATLPAAAEARLPDCYMMDGVISLYNEQLVQAFMAISPTETATKVSLYRTYTASIEDNVLWCSSKDGQVELSAYFPDSEPDMSGLPATLGLNIAKGVDRTDFPVLKTAFANVIAQADSGADLQALLDWMDDATAGGEALTLDGYLLVHVHNDAGDIFSLVAEGLGGDAEPEPKSEPEPEPKSEPEPEPKPEPEPTAKPDSRPEQAPEPDATLAPRADSGTLLSWNGLEIIPLRTERWQFASGTISLRVYVRVVNQSDRKLSVYVEDMTVDGVALPSTSLFDILPGSDTGTDTDTSILIYMDENITDGAVRAVLYGTDMSMRLVVHDMDKFEELYTQEVRLDLSPLPDETTVMEPSGDPTPGPAVTAAPAPTSKSTYQPLFEGDKGEDVRRMQQKLIELGFLNDTADGTFGPRTAAAVREFCETNGLGSDSYASSDMLERLYSGYATPYQEPWVPLIFQAEARGEWRNARDQLSFRAKVTNTSRSHTVRAFELYMYATDVWGERIYSDSIYYGTTTKTIKPGQSAFSDYFLLPDRNHISTVWCGIKKVIFSDGTIRENDTVDYASWTIH